MNYRLALEEQEPEALRHQLQGCWSRRITDEHRLVYEVTEYTVRIIACRFHYIVHRRV